MTTTGTWDDIVVKGVQNYRYSCTTTGKCLGRLHIYLNNYDTTLILISRAFEACCITFIGFDYHKMQTLIHMYVSVT